MEKEVVTIKAEISFPNNQKKVMLDAQDLIIVLLCETNNETKEVTQYRVHLATQIANIIKNPIPIVNPNDVDITIPQ